MLHEIELRCPWMSADEADELLAEIKLTPPWQRQPKARTLGERLQVVYGERQRLQLWKNGLAGAEMRTGVPASRLFQAFRD